MLVSVQGVLKIFMTHEIGWKHIIITNSISNDLVFGIRYLDKIKL